MAKPDSIAVGSTWEQLALDHLRSRGLREVCRNYRCRLGEIDLVMQENDCLIFVEVRYRKSNRFASAAASVDARKQAKITRTAALFLGQHAHYRAHRVRFDVVAFDQKSRNQCTIQWLKDAFRPEN